MQVVQLRFAAVPPANFNGRAPAALLAGESATLCRRFREALVKSPEGFGFDVQLEGFPLVKMGWKPAGQTCGVLTFPAFVKRPGRNVPDLVCLLLNGLESPEDLAALARQAPIPAPLWQDAMNETKPVGFSFVFTAGRVREPATVTIISAFANTFFGQFGTNDVPDPTARK